MKLNLGLLRSLTAAGMIFAASAAQAGLDFTVSEAGVPGTAGSTFVADRINGNFNQTVAFGPGAGQVSANGVMDFTSYFNGISFVPSNVNLAVIPQFYGMYAVFSWSGTLSGTAVNNPNGQISLWIDPDQNTTKTLNPGAPHTIAGAADDYQLGTAADLINASLTVGTGWAMTYDAFALNAVDAFPGTGGDQSGAGYFVAPNPFHIRILFDGTFSSVSGTNPQTIAGAGTLQFVPEPGILALLGISLVGIGIGRRRRKV